MRSPIDVSKSNIASESTEKDEISSEYYKSDETQSTNRFNALQEPDPASFKFALQPSVLSKYVPGSTIDESDL
jgi:hypothetical protein